MSSLTNIGMLNWAMMVSPSKPVSMAVLDNADFKAIMSFLATLVFHKFRTFSAGRPFKAAKSALLSLVPDSDKVCRNLRFLSSFNVVPVIWVKDKLSFLRFSKPAIVFKSSSFTGILFRFNCTTCFFMACNAFNCVLSNCDAPKKSTLNAGEPKANGAITR